MSYPIVGFTTSAGQFIKYSTQYAAGTYYPAYYQQPANLMKVTMRICSAADAVVDAVEFLGNKKVSCTFHLT
jgi:hypothetical protein